VKRRELTFIIVALILAATIGGLIGDIIGSYLPESGAKVLFSKSAQIGVPTMQFEFYAVSMTFGLMFKINFMSVLLILLVIIYFRWWYL
jgi:uncharacterized membrane protein YeiH